MSKFIDAVTAELTGQRFATMTPIRFLVADKSVVKNEESDIGYEHRISVEWGFRAVTRSDRERERVLKSAILELREAVYGDIRKMLFDLERAVFQWEEQEVLKALEIIQREIRG